MNAADFLYVFIVDRSGSMGGSRIQDTKKAMALFIRSLPPQSKFQVISFGDYFSLMSIDGVQSDMIDYTEHNIEQALSQIEYFDSDYGGTEIYDPLCLAVDSLSRHQKETRIFLLTDGQVSDRENVIAKGNTGSDHIRIHTFGIGSGCDVGMVEQVAKNGRGSCSLVKDNDDNLKGLVISALANASEPSLKNCKFVFGSETTHMGEVFRSQLITRS